MLRPKKQSHKTRSAKKLREAAHLVAPRAELKAWVYLIVMKPHTPVRSAVESARLSTIMQT